MITHTLKVKRSKKKKKKRAPLRYTYYLRFPLLLLPQKRSLLRHRSPLLHGQHLSPLCLASPSKGNAAAASPRPRTRLRCLPSARAATCHAGPYVVRVAAGIKHLSVKGLGKNRHIFRCHNKRSTSKYYMKIHIPGCAHHGKNNKIK